MSTDSPGLHTSTSAPDSDDDGRPDASDRGPDRPEPSTAPELFEFGTSETAATGPPTPLDFGSPDATSTPVPSAPPTGPGVPPSEAAPRVANRAEPTRADGVPPTKPSGEGVAQPSPAPRPGGGKKPPPRRRRKARRVHRVVHHFDIWSVAKVSGAFATCGYLVTMISGYLLWQVADRVGTIEGVEGFMEDTGGYDTFLIEGDVIFRVAAFVGAVAAILVVCLAILGAILFNLISDLTGGIRLTVIDEDLIVTPARREQRPRGS